jgi:hypothetical protein
MPPTHNVASTCARAEKKRGNKESSATSHRQGHRNIKGLRIDAHSFWLNDQIQVFHWNAANDDLISQYQSASYTFSIQQLDADGGDIADLMPLAIREDNFPRFDTIRKVIAAMGLKLTVTT